MARSGVGLFLALRFRLLSGLLPRLLVDVDSVVLVDVALVDVVVVGVPVVASTKQVATIINHNNHNANT